MWCTSAGAGALVSDIFGLELVHHRGVHFAVSQFPSFGEVTQLEFVLGYITCW